ncbi:energy transducer TonB [Novosphingobium sp. ZW T3_23]|uniref:energy transducer TonB n=1 Tax=Novosphingobium sp. ZW T3_23 TaxID=3378084 RepID=UPI003854CC69
MHAVSYRRTKRAITAAALLATSAMAVTGTVASAAAQNIAVHRFEIPAQPLLRAIAQFNRQSGIQITAEGGLVTDRAAAAVSGDFETSEALGVMLSGTGLAWRWIDDRTVALEPLAEIAGRNVLSASFSEPGAPAVSAEGETAAQVLPEVVADGEGAGDTYAMGTGSKSGESTIGEKDVRARAPGSGDANQLLKILPTVQFSNDEGLATREDILDLRPSDISISGGRYYDNLITLDGIDVNARVDTTQNTPGSVYELAGASAESIWVDSNLIGEMTVRDSNVSAQYGRFTGGALDIKTRAPRREWGVTGSVSYTSDALTNYKVSDASREALEGKEMPEQPAFEKWRYGVTVDVPVSPDIGLLVAYNRSRANVTYQRNESYDRTRFGQSSVSDNMLAKFDADLSADLKLTGQFVYSPYSSEYSDENAVENMVTSNGGGVTGKMELAHSGSSDWALTATYSHSDTGRDAGPIRYIIPSWTTNGGVCSSTNCTRGGYGVLNQTQDNYGLAGRWSHDLGPGTLSAGFDYQHIDAMRSRPEENWSYTTGTSRANAGTIVCADGDSMTCVTGEYALTSASRYAAYTAQVRLDSVASWAEYAVSFGRLSARVGLRHDYESFLGNHNFAPRLSATYELPWAGWSVTLGANRYYGRSMLSYALRSQYPDNYAYKRVATVSGGMNVYSDSGWYLSSTNRSTSYSGSNLKTPFADELSAALSAGILGGSLRIKGIYRESKDEFMRSPGERLTTTLENGKTGTYTNHILTNDGSSSYKGASIEWNRSFGKHSIAVNANISKTVSSNLDYFSNADDILDDTMIALDGQVLSAADVAEMNQRAQMAAPFIVNASWTARWFDDRLTTNVNVRYRNGYTRIENTNDSTTIDGVTYDLYDHVAYPKSIDANLNAQFEVIRAPIGGLTLEARVANLLDRMPSPNSRSTEQPYQYGRSVWFGLTYRY